MENNPQSIEGRDDTYQQASRSTEPAHFEKIEKLTPGAEHLIDTDKDIDVVLRLLSRHPDPEEIPLKELQAAADEIGGYEPEMVIAIARVLDERGILNKPTN